VYCISFDRIFIPIQQHGFHYSGEPFSGRQNAVNAITRGQMTLNRAFHDLAEVAFSCHQKARNALTRGHVALNRVLHVSEGVKYACRKTQEIGYTMVGSLEKWVHDSAEMAFSGLQNAENELKLR
jgi:hypothetical protein